METIEPGIEFAAYQEYLAENDVQRGISMQREREIYRDAVEEWENFHNSVDDLQQFGFAGMLALLRENVASRGISVTESHNFCVNAELDARFKTHEL